jgi:hypothetical protein
MLTNLEDEESWRRKDRSYTRQGISRWPEAGDESDRVLLVTVDDEAGGIDSAEIEAMLNEVMA